MTRALLLIGTVALAALGGCGRKGDPVAPRAEQAGQAVMRT